MLSDTVRRTIRDNHLNQLEVIELEEGQEDSGVLSHYGRKGMKWGIRRSKKELAGGNKGITTAQARKKARKMSDEELQKALKRLDMEKRYTELAPKANPATKSRMERGRSEMASIAKNSARNALTAHTTNVMKIGLTYAIQKGAPNYKGPGGSKKKNSRSS